MKTCAMSLTMRAPAVLSAWLLSHSEPLSYSTAAPFTKTAPPLSLAKLPVSVSPVRYTTTSSVRYKAAPYSQPPTRQEQPARATNLSACCLLLLPLLLQEREGGEG